MDALFTTKPAVKEIGGMGVRELILKATNGDFLMKKKMLDRARKLKNVSPTSRFKV